MAVMKKLTEDMKAEAQKEYTARKTDRKLEIAKLLAEGNGESTIAHAAIAGILSAQLADHIGRGVDGVVPQPGFTLIRQQLETISRLIG
jgi:hypothetical protein